MNESHQSKPSTEQGFGERSTAEAAAEAAIGGGGDWELKP